MARLDWTPPNITTRKAIFTSNAEYSADVHFGRMRADGTVMPARPFMQTAVDETDITEVIKENFEGDISHAFEMGARVLEQGIKEQILAEKWKWDRITRRSDGSAAGTTRDIVDTGSLYRSQSVEFE